MRGPRLIVTVFARTWELAVLAYGGAQRVSGWGMWRHIAGMGSVCGVHPICHDYRICFVVAHSMQPVFWESGGTCKQDAGATWGHCEQHVRGQHGNRVRSVHDN